jgi:serine/threonine protein kinase
MASSVPGWRIEDFDVGPAVGKGRFGHVYACRDKRSGALVAIKILFKDKLESYGVVHQLQHEIEIHCRMEHPHGE